MIDRNVISFDSESDYNGLTLTHGQILIDEKDVPSEFFISEEELKPNGFKKKGLKYSEKRKRISRR